MGAKEFTLPFMVGSTARRRGHGEDAGLLRCGEEPVCRVNTRVHRETAAVPAARLAAEREMLHPLPAEPHALALGEERLVADDQTVRFGSVRYSTPPGHAGTRVWCRAAGEELVITARTGRGAAEVARHRLSVPGSPQIRDEHYPHHPGGNGPPVVRVAMDGLLLVIIPGWTQDYLTRIRACLPGQVRDANPDRDTPGAP
jgi:hypothetical protein